MRSSIQHNLTVVFLRNFQLLFAHLQSINFYQSKSFLINTAIKPTTVYHSRSDMGWTWSVDNQMDEKFLQVYFWSKNEASLWPTEQWNRSPAQNSRKKNLSIFFLKKKFWRSSEKLKILHFFVLEAREERKYELSWNLLVRRQAEPRPSSHVVLTRRGSQSPSPSLSLRLSWTCHMTPKKELSLI